MVQRPNFLQLLSKNAVESEDLFIVNVVLFARHITNQVSEKLEEGALVGDLIGRTKSIEDLQNSLDCMLQVQAGVIGGDGFVGDDDQLGIVLDVVGVIRLMGFRH